MSIINFNLTIPSQAVTHLKDISYYNHNYYKLDEYGDWFFSEYDILKVVCHEDENCYTYSLGRFENEKFNGVLHWTTNEDIFE